MAHAPAVSVRIGVGQYDYRYVVLSPCVFDEQ